MCKPIDDPANSSSSSSSSSHPQLVTTAAPQHEQQQQQQQPRKRVRFGTSHEEFVVPSCNNVEEEKSNRWLSHQDFQAIRWEIGAVIKGRALGLDKSYNRRHGRHASTRSSEEDNIYCYRGLEFLKLENSTEPSRKERRSAFVKNVLVFQQVMNRKQVQVEQALGAYCRRMSEAAQERARSLASSDANEAREVYHECHLIYYETRNGSEVSMFPCSNTTRSSLCRSQVSCQESSAMSLQDVVSLLLSGVRSAALFASQVN